MKLNKPDLDAILAARKNQVDKLCNTMGQNLYLGQSHSQRRWDTWSALKTALEALDEVDNAMTCAMLDGVDVTAEVGK